LSNVAAVVGVGETDYGLDYQTARSGGQGPDRYGLAARAFTQALQDSDLKKSDLDGLIVGPSLATERMGEILGIDPRFSTQADAVNAIIQAVLALQSGLAECIALVYGTDQRKSATQYGGPQAMGGDRFLAYVYYSPWGLTSQGALYAMTATRFFAETGFTGDDLGRVAMGQRAFATLNDNAIMRSPLGLDDYRRARFVCEPLRLFDYCLINDGGVALILTTTERARRMSAPLVEVAAVAKKDLNRAATTLRSRLADFYHPAHREVAEDIYEIVGFGPESVDAVQIYDSFSIHVPIALEGFGFCAPGDAASLVRSGALAPGGRLPTNTSGGMLSESYMQGWNHQVEAVRQLRGQCGRRQVPNARHVQYLSDVAGKVASIIYRRSTSQ